MRVAVFIVLAGLVAAGLSVGLADGGPPADRPVDVAAPRPAVQVAGLSFDAAATAAATLPRLRSLLVSVDGQLRTERYFHGAVATRTANIKSAAKSVIATLVGIAIDRGHITSTREPHRALFSRVL